MNTRFLTVALLALAPPAGAQTPEAADPKRLAAGTEGFFRPGALIQGWYTADVVKADPADTKNTFRIRRAEISVKGEILPRLLAYRVMIDPAKVLETQDVTVIQDDPATPADETVKVKQAPGAISVLQDVEITFLSEWADVSLGQFKIPVSWEGYNSSSKLLFPERAQVARDFGDKRDLGVKVEKKLRYAGYTLGIFNGSQLNNADADDAKDLGFRLEGYPIDGLVVAGVVYATLMDRDVDKKDRYEGDLRFERGPFLLQSEYIHANDSGTKAQGAYGALAWTFFGRLQPCARVGFIDPDTSQDLVPAKQSDKDEAVIVEGGVNYYLQKHEAKVQLSSSRFGYDDKKPVTTIISAAQVSF
jgi:phosphate-selective porin O/P